MFVEHAIHLLHEATYGTLATQAAALPGYPYATVVPYVTDEGHQPVFCISALAEHTRNLLADSRASLSVLEPAAVDVQGARRLTMVGDAERFEPNPELLARYLRYEPGAERLLTLDFTFFRLNLRRIRFIEGVGRMGWLEKSDLDAAYQLPVDEEANILREVSQLPPAGVRVLGIDCYGIDYAVGALRKRIRFPSRSLPPEAIREAALSMVPTLD